jgi:hypothetical protein
MTRSREPALLPAGGLAAWIALVSASSVLFSLTLACATPFAALATVSGLGMRRGQTLALMGMAWAANQAVGYGLLGYPRTPDSFAWGAAIGLAALGAAVAVTAVRARSISPLVALGVAFALAFAVYECVLFAATGILPSAEGAFSAEVVGRFLFINLLALLGLLLLHRLALAVRLLPPAEAPLLARA